MGKNYTVRARVRMCLDTFVDVHASSVEEAALLVKNMNELNLADDGGRYFYISGGAWKGATLSPDDLELAFDKIVHTFAVEDEE